ncbi:MAG: hypothetical protein V3U75_09210 [Methylococcaceae bacterium]
MPWLFTQLKIMLKISLLSVVITIVLGCTATGVKGQRSVDYKNSIKEPSEYQHDLHACKEISENIGASQMDSDDITGALVTGGIVGLAAYGPLDKMDRKKEMIQRCMVKNGWVFVQ